MRKKLNISYNPNMSMNNQQQQNANNNQNNQKGPTNSKRSSSKRNMREEKLKRMKELEIEAQKKENQLEDEIRDHLKCYICLGKVFKPKMCRYCKKICCSACIDQWLQDHSFCGICKHNVSSQDMISVPFIDDMSTFFINNIDNQKKKIFDKTRTTVKKVGQNIISGTNNRNNPIKLPSQLPNINININNNIDNNIDNINNNNLTNIEEEEDNLEMDENICLEHNERICYYCIQCDKYFCSKCLVFFGQEVNKHKNHFIVQASKINDLGVTQAIKEYKKLGDTKEKIKNLIGLINMIKKEKEIKKYEFLNIIQFIKEYNEIKLNYDMNRCNNAIKSIKMQRDLIENKTRFLPNELNNVLEQNDINKANQINNEISSLNNNLLPQYNNIINELNYQSQNIYIYTYQTNFMTKKLNINENLNDNCELINTPIPFINFHSSNFGINYSHGNFGIYLSVDTKKNANSPDYPVFNAYIIFRTNGYGLEFLTLKNDYLEKIRNGIIVNNLNLKEQINKIEIEKNRFLFLCDNNYQITFKICVVKLEYK